MGKHIVIVENDRAMLELMRDFLSHEGYRISCFTSAGEVLSQEPADLVIADFLMHSMVKTIFPSSPFILISPFGIGSEKGKIKLLHKPFSFTEFKQMVQEHLIR